MKLEGPDGRACFELEPKGPSRGGVAFLLPTNSKAREGGSFRTNTDGMAEILGSVGAKGEKIDSRSDGLIGAEPKFGNGVRWPVPISVERLPPFVSRLDPRAFFPRMGYAMQTSARNGVERFDRRGTEPNELFEPFEPFEFFQDRNFHQKH